MISSYGDQSTARNNPSYYYRASTNAASNCSECFQRHLMFYTCNYNIRVTHEMIAIKHFFFTRIRSTEGSSADCSLFILSLHACLHLAVKILLQIFLYEDLSTLYTYICRLCSLQNASRTALCYAANAISENIPNI